jgi:hypothetical protein
MKSPDEKVPTNPCSITLDRSQSKGRQKLNNTEEKQRDNSQSFRDSQFRPSTFNVAFGRTESGMFEKERKNTFTGVDIPKKKKVENVKHQTYDVIKGEVYKEPRQRSALKEVGTPNSKDGDLSSCERI